MSDAARAALEDAGARLGPRFGRDAVLDFGDVAREADALAGVGGVVPLLGLSTHAVAGADATSFLHRMLTQDVKALAVGDAVPALFLDARGRIQGDPLAWRTAEGFLLVEEPAAAARAIPSLERYVIADDVTFTDASGAWTSFLVTGERALAAASSVDAASLGILVARVDLRGRAALRVLAPPALAPAVADLAAGVGAALCGELALDVLRAETGTPWFGAELDDRVIPNEAALDASISWTKGCYLGQEPVVMARHRGRPPTRLVRLSIDGDGVPAVGSTVSLEGKPVGRLTTCVRGRDARPAALGYVRTEHARAGAALALDGGVARVEAVAGG